MHPETRKLGGMLTDSGLNTKEQLSDDFDELAHIGNDRSLIYDVSSVSPLVDDPAVVNGCSTPGNSLNEVEVCCIEGN